MKKTVLWVLLVGAAAVLSAQSSLLVTEVSKNLVPLGELAYLEKLYQSDRCLFSMPVFGKPAPVLNGGFLYVTYYNKNQDGDARNARTWQLQLPFDSVYQVVWDKKDRKVAYVSLNQFLTNGPGYPREKNPCVKIFCDGQKTLARFLSIKEAEKIFVHDSE